MESKEESRDDAPAESDEKSKADIQHELDMVRLFYAIFRFLLIFIGEPQDCSAQRDVGLREKEPGHTTAKAAVYGGLARCQVRLASIKPFVYFMLSLGKGRSRSIRATPSKSSSPHLPCRLRRHPRCVFSSFMFSFSSSF